MAATASFLLLLRPPTTLRLHHHRRRATTTTTTISPPTRRRGRPRKNPPKPPPQTPPKPSSSSSNENEDEDSSAYDDGIDFPYMDPPLLCCFGSAKPDFIPTVRVNDEPMHPDIYSEWKLLQWNPPEFARAPGGPPSNVAISHVRLGGRAAMVGKVGDDGLGKELVRGLNVEGVQTRGIRIGGGGGGRTCVGKVRIRLGNGEEEDGRMWAEVVEPPAEERMIWDELNLAVLKEARVIHFNSEVFTSPSMVPTLFRAISFFKKFGGLVFFDLNLPLPLWKSRDETRELLRKAWEEADIIEVSREELEFLLDEEYYLKRRYRQPQYYADNYDQCNGRRDYYHYTPEEISPLWHDRLKFLFITDGTLRIHYYSPSFDGVVVGTEDVLVTPFTCDRTGSGDAIVAALIRKLIAVPDMFHNEDVLQRQLRFAIAAGIISQWTIGSVRGYPTENATQNMKEEVYIPELW